MNAGKHFELSDSTKKELRFNEAGAMNAGKRHAAGGLLPLFGQASMRPAQ